MSEASRLEEALAKAGQIILQLKRNLEQERRARREPLAILGTGCRLPGGVHDLASLWQLLQDERDAVGPIPATRIDLAAHYAADPQSPGKTYVREGAFLDAIDGFDAGFFGISPREAAWLDPQHRLLLECSWEALEQAGLPAGRLRKTRVGVYVGIGPSDYSQRIVTQPPGQLDAYAATGTGQSFAAGRLSFLLGLQGPAVAVDTACSSSLVALHLACQALRAGECELALAGGVQVMLAVEPFIVLSRLKALASDGRCKTFSERADGYGRGEGCGVVVLKRLSEAQRDGDPIAAVILGTAINHDGPSSGLTTPSGSAQRQVLRQALTDAGVAAASVDYVEAHGTGTALGDPIEAAALAEVYGEAHTQPLQIGSVKTNLGHLESASGIAGVLKVVAALQRGVIPASLHSTPRSPQIDWDRLPLHVAKAAQAWPAAARPRRAGVSAFGMSGTNAHLVLEQAPPVRVPAAAAVRPAELIVLSARTPAALAAAAAQLAAWNLPEDAGLGDLSYSLATAREPMEHRLAVVAESLPALRSALAAAARSESSSAVARGVARAGGKLAWLFTGQGAQWPRMGRALYATWEVFRQQLDAAMEALDPYLDRPLQSVLWAEPGSEAAALLVRTDYTQPALFALAWALAGQLRAWGIRPALLAGHSLGEIIAAAVAGVFSLGDAARLVARRGRLMQELTPPGAMVAIAAPEAEVAAAIAQDAARVSIAAINGPRSVVVSGDANRVAVLAEGFAARGIRTRRLAVSHAFHSPLMEPMLAEFQRVAEAVAYRPASIPVLSGASGALAGAELSTAAYWVQQVQASVRFADQLQTLDAAGVSTLLEVGPGETLLGLAADSPIAAATVLLPTLRSGLSETASLLQALAGLYVGGATPDWQQVFPGGGRRVALPTYPWQRQRHFIAAPVRSVAELGGAGSRWPLAGRSLRLPGGIIHHVLSVSPRHQPFLADHVVHGRIVVPGAFHVAAVLAMAAALWPGQPLEVRAVEFPRALLLEVDQEVELHGLLTPDGPGFRFELATKEATASSWTTHAQGHVAATEAQPAAEAATPWATGARQRVAVSELLQRLANDRIEFGPQWRWLQQLEADEGMVRGELVPTDSAAHEWAPLHPALLDNGLAAAAAARNAPSDGEPRIPTGLERLRWWRPPSGRVRCTTTLHSVGPQASVADAYFVDENDNPIAEVQAMTAQRAPAHRLLPQASASCAGIYHLAFGPLPLPRPQRARAHRWLVVAPRPGGLAQAIAQQLPKGPAGGQVTATAELAAVLDAAPANIGVLCIWEPPPAAEPPTAALALTLDALRTLQLLGQKASGGPLLWVTRGAIAVQPGEPIVPAAAALLGLGRTIQQEQAELRCTLVDVSAEGDAVSDLLAELGCDDAEPQLAWRGGQRYGARLVRAPQVSQALAPTLRGPYTWLVSGGLGALGRAVAQWLAAQGVAHLLLVGRRGEQTPGAQEAVAGLVALGARVSVATADVAQAAEVAAVLAAVPTEFPLRGVVHAAGIRGDGLIANQTAESVTEVMAPKIEGAWNLHTATRGLPLQHFILFSSVAATLGAAGQAVYAAANAFLDGLAALRQAQGDAGQSLAWGPWGAVGMAAALDERQRNRLSRRGMDLLPQAVALELFAAALTRPEAQLILLQLNEAELAGAAPFRTHALYTELLPQSAKPRPAVPQGNRLALEALPAASRTAAVTERIRRELANTLALPSSAEVPAEKPLQQLGLDSLLAAELRNRIFELSGVRLSLSQIWEAQDCSGLARTLLARMEAHAAPPPHSLATAAAEAVAQPAVEKFPLTERQYSILHHATRSGNGLLVLYNRFVIAGPIADRIDTIVGSLTRYEVFQKCLIEESPEPLLCLYHEPWERQAVVTVCDDLHSEAQIDARADADLAAGFDVTRKPLWRLTALRRADSLWTVLLAIHHVILDGTATFKVLSELDRALAGQPKEGDGRAAPYRTYIAWWQAKDHGKASRFWRRYLTGVVPFHPFRHDRPPAAPIPSSAAPDAPREPPRVDSISVSLPGLLLEKPASRFGVTLSTLIQGAWAMTLSAKAGTRSVLFGVTDSGRGDDPSGAQSVVGCLINTTPVAVSFADESVRDFLLNLFHSQAQRLENAWCRTGSTEPGQEMFDSVIVSQDFTGNRPLPFAAIRDYRRRGYTNFGLQLRIWVGEEITIQINYAARRYAAAKVRELADCLGALLRRICDCAGDEKVMDFLDGGS